MNFANISIISGSEKIIDFLENKSLKKRIL